MLTSHQIRQGRELLNWSRAELSLRTFLPLVTVEAVERPGGTLMLPVAEVSAIRRALEDAGVEFADAASGARLKVNP